MSHSGDSSRSSRSLSRATSRRRFLALVGAAGLSSSLAAPVAVLAQSSRRTVPRPPPKREPVAPAKTDSPAPPEASEFAEDAKALAAVLERRYGKHLDAKQLEAVTKELENRMQGGKALRAAKLANSDEPDFSFHA